MSSTRQQGDMEDRHPSTQLSLLAQPLLSETDDGEREFNVDDDGDEVGDEGDKEGCGVRELGNEFCGPVGHLDPVCSANADPNEDGPYQHEEDQAMLDPDE